MCEKKAPQREQACGANTWFRGPKLTACVDNLGVLLFVAGGVNNAGGWFNGAQADRSAWCVRGVARIAAIAVYQAFGYTPCVAENSATHGISSPEFKGGHTAISAVFLCPQHGEPVLWAGRVGVLRGCRFPLSRSANPHGSALPISSGKRKTTPHQRNIAMTSNQAPTQTPPTLRQLSQRYRRAALAALRIPASRSFRLSRYWSYIGRARALEALDYTGLRLTAETVEGGQR